MRKYRARPVMAEYDTIDRDSMYDDLDSALTSIIRRFGGDPMIAGQSSRYNDTIDDILYLIEMSKYPEEEI